MRSRWIAYSLVALCLLSSLSTAALAESLDSEPAPLAPRHAPHRTRSRAMMIVGGMTLVLGVAATITGAVMFARASAPGDACGNSPTACNHNLDRQTSDRTGGLTLSALGGPLTGGGAALLASGIADHDEPACAPAFRF